MNSVSGPNSLLYSGMGTIWANEMNFGLKHAPGAGSLTRPADLQSNPIKDMQEDGHKRQGVLGHDSALYGYTGLGELRLLLFPPPPSPLPLPEFNLRLKD